MEYRQEFLKLQRLKLNPNKMNQAARLEELIKTISEHPDGLQIFANLRLIDPEHLTALQKKGATGRAVAESIFNNIQIKTPNSDDLSYRYYGYIRHITADELDQLIDRVATRLQIQAEIQEMSDSQQYEINTHELENEDELTLDELNEGL